MKTTQKLFISAFGLYSRMFSRHAARVALNWFQKPTNKKVRTREKEFYAKAHESVNQDGTHFYEMGDTSKPSLLFVHGWDSHPGSLYGVMRELLNEYHIVAVTLPAHGKSLLSNTNLFHSSQALQNIFKQLEVDKSWSIIAHSFGSAVTAHALHASSTAIDKLVFITSPNRMVDIFRDYRDMIGLGPKAFEQLLNITHAEIGPVRTLAVQNLLKEVSYTSLTMIHDPMDKVIPFSNSESIVGSNTNTSLISLPATGHYRILWSEELFASIRTELSIKGIRKAA